MEFNTFIWGSCVSRDIPRVTGAFDVSHYVGRQSIISGFNEPTGITPPFPNDLSSRFKTRSLSNDLRSMGPSLLERYADSTDLVLFDLATERRGIFQIGERKFISNTVELKQSGLLDFLKLDDSKLIPFGSDLHLSLFAEATKKLSKSLDALGLLRKALVINAPFAARTKEGKRLSPNLGRSASEWNKLFPVYFEILSSNGLAVTTPPQRELILSTKDHLWKQGQDHYIDETYFFWAEQISKFAAINGYGPDGSAVDRRSDSIRVALPGSADNVRLIGRRRADIQHRRFAINAELRNLDGITIPIHHWPVYKTTAKSAKFIPQGHDGELFKLPSIHVPSNRKDVLLTLSTFDKSHKEIPAIDLLIVGYDEKDREVFRRSWNL